MAKLTSKRDANRKKADDLAAESQGMGGKYLTDYDKDRFEKRSGVGNLSAFHMEDGKVIAGRRIQAPSILQDEANIEESKKKKIGARQRRSGRASTILGDTLG